MTKEEMNTAEADCLRCYEQGYEQGYFDATQNAVNWLNDRLCWHPSTYGRITLPIVLKELVEALKHPETIKVKEKI